MGPIPLWSSKANHMHCHYHRLSIHFASTYLVRPSWTGLGFKIGGLSNWYEYLKLAKFLGGDKDRLYGSTYGNTIYWQIVGEKIYY